MIKQCTYCTNEAEYGVESTEGGMNLYLCPLDFSIYMTIDPEAIYWFLNCPDSYYAIKENKEAKKECEEVLGRPIITTYNNTTLGSKTISTLQ